MIKNTTKDEQRAIKRKAQKGSMLSTQKYLQFAEAHDNILVLKDGGIRAVLEVSSVNFNLKSESEQDAIISGYQSFLNALNFPVQILIKSRKLDIDGYIDLLKDRMRKITNSLLKQQMEGYIEFVSKLVEFSDIMEKKFYVVVPVTPARAETKSALSSFLAYIAPGDTVMDILKRKAEFKNLKKQLETRINVTKTALENCGVGVRQLKTEEIIEIFYKTYNPQMARNQKIENLEEIALEKN
ncbi:hypothetical protein CSB37_01815 [bacterium DOLZORAL124_38_8]|nr:MAG: hypothetical protein CSB37_01815 [bacterium DOLZORAL124_38_8]